jgi:hypothetical protein
MVSTDDVLKRIAAIRAFVDGYGAKDEKITKDDLKLLIDRIEALDDREILNNAEAFVEWGLKRMEETLARNKEWLADCVEQMRVAELMVRESEHAVAALQHLVDGELFAHGDEINWRFDAMQALYEEAGLLLAPAPAPEEQPAPEVVPEEAPEPFVPREPPPTALTPAEQETATLAAIERLAGDEASVQASLGELALSAGLPKGSIHAVLQRLSEGKKIEIVPYTGPGAKQPNRYVINDRVPKGQEPAKAAPAPAPYSDFNVLRDRICGALRSSAGTTSGLASLLDVKELTISQTLASMQHEGTVVPDEMPEAGRGAQLWRLTGGTP